MRALITRFVSLLDPVGTRCEISRWDGLVSRPVESERKETVCGWSPAVFRRNRRCADGVESVGALVLDRDDGVALDSVAELWADVWGFVHSTWSSTPEHPKSRIVIPLGRRVSPTEHASLWRWAQSRDPRIDPSCRDASRFWFQPSRRPGARYGSVELTGAILDVDEALRAVPRPSPPHAAPASSFGVGQVGDLRRRARGYLARVPPAISGSGGHQVTWAAALALVKGFSLDPQTALTLLSEWNQCCQPPWSARELQHKIAHAMKSNVRDGYLLGDDRRTA